MSEGRLGDDYDRYHDAGSCLPDIGQEAGMREGREYRAWDQKERLGEPPWRSDDPKVVAWEKAHGHDARLKCYPEFGCQLAIDELRAAAQAAVDNEFGWRSRLKAALGAVG